LFYVAGTRPLGRDGWPVDIEESLDSLVERLIIPLQDIIDNNNPTHLKLIL